MLNRLDIKITFYNWLGVYSSGISESGLLKIDLE